MDDNRLVHNHQYRSSITFIKSHRVLFSNYHNMTQDIYNNISLYLFITLISTDHIQGSNKISHSFTKTNKMLWFIFIKKYIPYRSEQKPDTNPFSQVKLFSAVSYHYLHDLKKFIYLLVETGI